MSQVAIRIKNGLTIFPNEILNQIFSYNVFPKDPIKKNRRYLAYILIFQHYLYPKTIRTILSRIIGKDFKHKIVTRVYWIRLMMAVNYKIEWFNIIRYNNDKITNAYIRILADNICPNGWKKIFTFGRSTAFIMEFEHKISDDTYHVVLKHSKVPESFIEKNIIKLNKTAWKCIAQYQTISNEFMEKYYDKLCKTLITRYQVLSNEFIRNHMPYLNWHLICQFQQLDSQTIIKYKPYIKWTELSRKASLATIQELKDLPWNWQTMVDSHREFPQAFLDACGDKHPGFKNIQSIEQRRDSAAQYMMLREKRLEADKSYTARFNYWIN